MSRLVLGPPGVLPPGEWAVGARVRLRGQTYVTVRRLDGGGLFLSAGPADAGECSPMDARVAVRLDLTVGPVDFGTRALLALVAPDVPQPLTGPRWERILSSSGSSSWWGLSWWDAASGVRDSRWMASPDMCRWVPALRANCTPIEGISEDPGACPRAALAQALRSAILAAGDRS